MNQTNIICESINLDLFTLWSFQNIFLCELDGKLIIIISLSLSLEIFWKKYCLWSTKDAKNGRICYIIEASWCHRQF